MKTKEEINTDEFDFTFEDVIEDTISIEKTDDGYEAKYLVIDTDAISPNEEDNEDICFLVHYHRQFYVENKNVTETELSELYGNEGTELGDYYVFFTSALIHSGVTLSLGKSFAMDPQGWDTSHCGAILVNKNSVKDREQAYKMASGKIDIWNTYLSNDVYCIVKEIFDNEKTSLNYDIVCGFYGVDYAKESLKINF